MEIIDFRYEPDTFITHTLPTVLTDDIHFKISKQQGLRITNLNEVNFNGYYISCLNFSFTTFTKFYHIFNGKHIVQHKQSIFLLDIQPTKTVITPLKGTFEYEVMKEAMKKNLQEYI